MQVSFDIFVGEIAILADWYGKEISKPLMDRMYSVLQVLTPNEFTEACKGVLANERFFPPLNRFIELARPEAIEEAKEQWMLLTTCGNDLTIITKCLSPYLKTKSRFDGPGVNKARDEFIAAYIHASIESRRDILTPRRVDHELFKEMERLQINAALQPSWADKPSGKVLVSDLNQQERISYLRHLKSQKLLEAAS